MIELPHTIVGAAIATKVGNPALALPLALASHFVLDLIPHWNPHLSREKRQFGYVTARTIRVVAADTFLSLAVGLFMASQVLPDVGHFITVLLGAFFAVLPDVLEGPYFFFGWNNPAIKRLVAFQSSLQFNIPFIPGLVSQLLIIGAAFWWIYV